MYRISRQTAEGLCAGLIETMEALIALIEEESELVRDGKLFAAVELKPQEAFLVQRYGEELRGLEALAAELEQAAPAALEQLRRQHEGFRSLLRINLAALATARELSDMRLREVSERHGMNRRPRGGDSPAAVDPAEKVARRA